MNERAQLNQSNLSIGNAGDVPRRRESWVVPFYFIFSFYTLYFIPFSKA